MSASDIADIPMKLHLPRFADARVLVVGDIMLDRYWHGATARISPEAPVPVVKVGEIEDRPGGAANVALNLAALGAVVSLAGITGDDEAAAVLESRLQAAGVAPQLQRNPQLPTITKLRVISRQQQLIRMDFEETLKLPAGVELVGDAALQQAGVLVLSDYAKGTLADPQALIQRAKARQLPVLVDPKGNDFHKYRGATLLTPNLGEFEAVVGHSASEAELVVKAETLIRELDLQALLITRGEQGMSLIRLGAPELHLPAQAREVFDVTGAGDTVIATLAAALAAGESLSHAVALANLAASIVVGKLGTATVSAVELQRLLRREQGGDRGVLTVEQLQVLREEARAIGETVVFTNGCFDILHAGHVTYLEQARARGDRLIVAINDDASVTRLKGPGRPINPVDGRMAVLAGLEAVDWVVSFSEDTPENLLHRIQPDVLVKGGDYSREQVVGWQIVEGYGGRVDVLSHVEGCSTTAIVERVVEKNR